MAVSKMYVLSTCFILILFTVGSNAQDGCPVRNTSLTCKGECAATRLCKRSTKVCECDGNCGWSCLRHGCPPPVVPENGIVTIKPENRSIDSIATFSCLDGYALQGSSGLRCLDTKTWNSTSDASCLEVCNKDQSAVDSLGRTCKRSCVDDSTCLRDRKCVCDGICGKSCIPIERENYCDPASIGINNTVLVIDPPSAVFGSIARYTCAPNTTSDVENIERKCQGDGWSEGTISCVPIDSCTEPPPEIGHGSHDATKTYYLPGEFIRFTCDPGYYSSSSKIIFCLSVDSTYAWTEKPDDCSPKSCGPPGQIANGYYDTRVYTFLSSATYECDEGYKLVGRSTRYCQANQQWSGIAPSCGAVMCHALTAPVNGYKIGSGRGYNSEVTFGCNAGYSIDGDSSITCQNDETWSAAVPRCTPFCQLPSNTGNVQWQTNNGCQGGLSQPNGCSLSFTCDEGYSANRGGVAYICSGGEWRHDFEPFCEIVLVLCQLPLNTGHVQWHTNDGCQEGLSQPNGCGLSFTCDEGYSANKGGVAYVCSDGEWRHDFEPVCNVRCYADNLKTLRGIQLIANEDKSAVSHGVFLSVRCQDGKLVNGNDVMCNNGEWDYRGMPRAFCLP